MDKVISKQKSLVIPQNWDKTKEIWNSFCTTGNLLKNIFCFVVNHKVVFGSVYDIILSKEMQYSSAMPFLSLHAYAGLEMG